MAESRRKKAGKKGSEAPQLHREMWGILFLGFALLLGGALVSLQFGDGRLMGPFGQALALGLFSLLGLGSHLVVVALFSVAWGIFSRRFSVRDGRLWLGYTGATLCGTVLFTLIFSKYRLQGMGAGGRTGELLAALGVSLVSKAGTFILFTMGLLLFLMLATQSSPARAIVGLVEGTSALFAGLGRMFGAVGRFFVQLFSWEPLEDEPESEALEGDEPGSPGPARQADASDTVPMTAPAAAAGEPPPASGRKRKPASSEKPSSSESPSSTESPSSSESPSSTESPSSPGKPASPKKPASAGPAPGTPALRLDSSPSAAIRPPVTAPLASPSASPGPPVAEPSPVPAETAAEPDGDELIPGAAAPMPEGGPRIIELEAPSADTLRPVSSFTDDWGQFRLPDPELLHYEPQKSVMRDREHMLQLAARLEQAFLDYKIKGSVQEIHVGPVITMYEFVPEAGIRVSRIESLAKDLALSLAATRVRIVAPIPGKSAVGIEVPNEAPQMVFLKEIVADPAFSQSKSKLTMAMGKDIKGRAVVSDLAKAPHLLIAGTTGSGKSVGVNAMILSILFRASPRDVRMILIDPKMVEFSIYNDIPHLLLPVVTDPQQANLALQWAVREMERRYQMLSDLAVRDLGDYNQKAEEIRRRGIEDAPEHLPFIVIVIDEFADLMMVAAKEVETAVARIAQKARAVGIHLITATQRPSTDVITGLIKSNFPTRIAFMVASRIDSKVILDQMGAEALLGNGDMLWSNRGLAPNRVHGAFISTAEVQAVVEHLRAQGRPSYDMSIVVSGEEGGGGFEDEPYDVKWEEAVDIVVRDRIASISYVQRRLKIGYNRAARMIERMEHEGIVSPPNGTNQREVLLPPR
jgi:DNA segregation ATPase FtsK/SpoIIIE, S-DNA-T family